MKSIRQAFADCKNRGEAALMPFLSAGDPNLAFTTSALAALADSGAALIEVGVPFSDPVADGPVIQASYTRALAAGFRMDDFFSTMAVASKARPDVPLVAMASYSLIFKRGIGQFISDAQAAGLRGAVVPDLPVEEAEELSKAARDRGFDLILLVTPTTTPERAERIVKACSGFVYVVSTVGITGGISGPPQELTGLIAHLRTLTDLPLAVGFGISRPEQVKEVASIADGVIVGSALVKMLDQPNALQNLSSFTSSLAAACRSR